jgi:hypothetical protein
MADDLIDDKSHQADLEWLEAELERTQAEPDRGSNQPEKLKQYPQREAAFFGSRKVSVTDDVKSRIPGKHVPDRSKVFYYSHDFHKSKISIKQQSTNNNGQAITPNVAKRYRDSATWMRSLRNEPGQSPARSELPRQRRRLERCKKSEDEAEPKVGSFRGKSVHFHCSPEMAKEYRDLISLTNAQPQGPMIRESSIAAKPGQQDTVRQTSLAVDEPKQDHIVTITERSNESLAETEAQEQLTEVVAKAKKRMCICVCVCVCECVCV